MKLALRRVNGKRSFLSENTHIQRNVERETEIEKEYAKDTAGIASIKKWKLSNIEGANTLLVVATLIITATFSASLNPPGGWNSSSGDLNLQGKPSFKLFSYAIKFAFMNAVGSCLTLMSGKHMRKLAEYTLFIGGVSLFVALMSKLLAFLVGTSDAIRQASKNKTVEFMALIAPILLILYIPLFPCVVYNTKLYQYCIIFLLGFYSNNNAHFDPTI